MRKLFLLSVFACSTLLPASAMAATIAYNVSFTASGDVPANGSYTLTFDPTLAYSDTTTGLVVNSYNNGYGSPAVTAFNYDPTAGGVLLLGGTNNGVNGMAWGTNDYVLVINSFTTAPTLNSFYVSTTTLPSSGLTDYTGTVTVTPAVTPEPSSFFLVATGLIGVLNAARRHLIR